MSKENISLIKRRGQLDCEINPENTERALEEIVLN